MNPDTRKGVMLTVGALCLVILGALSALVVSRLSAPATPAPVAIAEAPAPAPVTAPTTVAPTPIADVSPPAQTAPTVATPNIAQVTNVQAHYVVRTIPIRVCHDEPRTGMVGPPPGPSGTTGVGAIVGGVAGGALGNQVGQGRGKTVATIGGAVLGALAGNTVEGNMNQPPPPHPETVIVPVCHTRYLPKSVINGYEVSYNFNGQTGTTIMKYAPVVGSTIPLTLQPSG